MQWAYGTLFLPEQCWLLPPGMPSDYQQLMEHCWASQPSARPTISQVLECLHYMISVRRQQHQQQPAATGGSACTTAAEVSQDVAATGPLPHLLTRSPPQRQQPSWQKHQQLGCELSSSQHSSSEAPAQVSGRPIQGKGGVMHC